MSRTMLGVTLAAVVATMACAGCGHSSTVAANAGPSGPLHFPAHNVSQAQIQQAAAEMAKLKGQAPRPVPPQ